MKDLNYFRFLGILFLLNCIPLWVFSQSLSIHGVVKDAQGETIIGASVLEKGQPMVQSLISMETFHFR